MAENLVDKKFQQFLDDLTQSDKPVFELQNEIQFFLRKINSNMKCLNIDSDKLNSFYQKILQNKEITLLSAINYITKVDKFELLLNFKGEFIIFKDILFLDSFFTNLFKINVLFETCREHFLENNFYDSYQTINEAKEFLKILYDEKKTMEFFNFYEDINFVKTKFEKKLNDLNDNFIYDLIQLFKQNIFIKMDNGQFIVQFNFLLEMSPKQYEDFVKCILNFKNEFKSYFANIFDLINNNIIKHILDNVTNTTIDLICQNGGSDFISKTSWNIKLISQSENENKPLESVKKLFETVLKLFTLNHSISCSSELIQFIGEIWIDIMIKYLFDIYFDKFIPTKESDFEKFDSIFNEASEFEIYIHSLCFPNENIQENLSQKYITIMKDNFSSITYEKNIIKMKELLRSDLSELISSEDVMEGLNSNRKLTFLNCKISRFMNDIKKLLQEMSESDMNSYYNVCDMFIIISPYLYKEQIERNPRMNAIFHNNCLFFSFLMKNYQIGKPRCVNEFNFKNLITSAKSLASQVFLDQMEYQENVLLSYTTKNDIFVKALYRIAIEIPSTDLNVVAQSHLEFRQSLNNSLSHLNLLYKEFNDILPEKLYNKVFSILITTLLTELIDLILSLEEISSLGSSHLSNEIEYFHNELRLFLVDCKNLLFKWMKLKEINFILMSSQLEIVNRWADGKGVLATYLTAEEVRHLITVIFSANEHRAAVLSKIK